MKKTILSPKGKIKTIMFHRPDLDRTELIEEWLDMSQQAYEQNGGKEQLTIICSKKTQKILDSITQNDYTKWLIKRGYINPQGGCRDICCTVHTDITGAHVVGDNQYDVGCFGRRIGQTRRAAKGDDNGDKRIHAGRARVVFSSHWFSFHRRDNDERAFVKQENRLEGKTIQLCPVIVQPLFKHASRLTSTCFSWPHYVVVFWFEP